MTPRRALAAALLATALTATAAPALAAPGDGTLVVTVVDQYGRPVAGYVRVVDTTGNAPDEQGASDADPFPFVATHSFRVDSSRRFGIVSVAPWTGLDCVQAAPCVNVDAPVASSDGIFVAPFQTVTRTVQVTVPTATATGSPSAGSALSVALSPGASRFDNFQSSSTTRGVQWLRGASPVPGATASTYTVTGDDGGQALSARLAPSPAMTEFFTGEPLSPFQTNAVAVAKSATKTKVGLPRRFATSERVRLTVKVKAAAGTPTGEVKVRIGAYGDLLHLKSGKATVRLPRFAVGTYSVKVKYAGSAAFSTSGSKKLKVTVTR